MSEYHEPFTELDAATRDAHRAMTSLKEEIEAADWYHQRLQLCTDPDLKRILEHNRNEEAEHASMLLEWLRRTKPEWNERLEQFLFTQRELGVEASADASSKNGASSGSGRGLGVGSLKQKVER